eukprot:TRINITY_DN1510_c6_g1_i1.p1 TRINITY_DN1510_c6_g1~~TRINITY_DN1510_c6_g1_i1.p1  ORF type:complete len:630 (+),score=46.64 TRINITY_DN1510_c6_g1_i1:46-1890(+)
MAEICTECGEVPRGPVCSRGRNAYRPHKLVSTGWSVKSPPGGSSPPGATSPRTGRSPGGSMYAKHPSAGGAGSGSSPSRSRRSRSRGKDRDRSRSRSRSRKRRSSSRGRRSSRSPSRRYSLSPPSGSVKSGGPTPLPVLPVAHNPQPQVRIWSGATVERNPAYWAAGDQDGGPGKRGTVVETGDGWVKVRWDENRNLESTHRWGAEGAFDVSVVSPVPVSPMNQVVSPMTQVVHREVVQEVPPPMTRSMEGSRQVVPTNLPTTDPDMKVYCRVHVEAIRNVKKMHYKLLPGSKFSQLLGELFTQLSLKPSEWCLWWDGKNGKIALSSEDSPGSVGMLAGLQSIHQLILSPRTNEDDWVAVGGRSSSPATTTQPPAPFQVQQGVVAELYMRPVSPQESVGVPAPHAQPPAPTPDNRLSLLQEENNELRAQLQVHSQQTANHRNLLGPGTGSTNGLTNGFAQHHHHHQQQQQQQQHIMQHSPTGSEGKITSPSRGLSPARWDAGSAVMTNSYSQGSQNQAFSRLKEVFMSYLSYGLTLPVTETERFIQFALSSGVPAQCGIPDQTIKILVNNMLGASQRTPLAFEEFTDALNLVATVIYPRDEYPLTRLLPGFRVS